MTSQLTQTKNKCRVCQRQEHQQRLPLYLCSTHQVWRCHYCIRIDKQHIHCTCVQPSILTSSTTITSDDDLMQLVNAVDANLLSDISSPVVSTSASSSSSSSSSTKTNTDTFSLTTPPRINRVFRDITHTTNIQHQDNNDMNNENDDSLFTTPVRRKKRIASTSSSTSSSTPTTPCSQCAYLFHNPNEIQELHNEIDSLKQNIQHLLENIEELKLINKEHQVKQASIAASITFIKQRPIHQNINVERRKHQMKIRKRTMCWRRRYLSCMYIYIWIMLYVCLCVVC